MNNIFKKLTEDLHLGELISSKKIIPGGALHQNWHIKTQQAEYVIKRINPYIRCEPRKSAGRGA